jgi:hypothetical protein
MSFQFHPELFDHRNAALEALDEHGLVWLSDFSSVDLLHDVFGLEVCGIAERSDAMRIKRILTRLFADWPHSHIGLKDYGDRDLGWKVIVHRDMEDEEGEEWVQA